MSDPFDALDQAVASVEGVVEKIEAEKRCKQAADAVENCRFTAVGQRSPAQAFFTNLALSLKPVPDATVDTMMTDGRDIRCMATITFPVCRQLEFPGEVGQVD
jgi:hypothetical protein